MPLHDVSSPGQPAGTELDYAQITSDVAISATTAPTANTVIDGKAVVYDGALRVKIEFWARFCDISAASYLIVDLWDGSTDLGRILQYNDSAAANGVPLYGVTFLTPTAASHTYHIKAYKTSGTGNIYANATDPGVPAFMRITVA